MKEAFYERQLAEIVRNASAHFPALLLTGPRQVGKTTLLESIAEPERRYVTLDDFDARSLAQNDPGLFIQSYRPPLIIDEIQYAPELFSYIKMVIDQEKTNGLFWLTGSQKFHLMKGVSESLAGRVAILDMLGLSQSEIETRASKEPFHLRKEFKATSSLETVYERIYRGSFPRVLNHGQRDLFYRSYVQTYIQRDIQEILNISNLNSFHNFLQALAARTANLLNFSELSKELGIDNKTVKSWLSALEASGIIYLLRPYHNNLNKRLCKTPKIYFLDSGLCAYLTKWPNAETLAASSMSGAFLETYLFSEILKSYWHRGLEAPLYYYRDTEQREIDLIIEEGDTLYPVECKKTATPSKTASKNFHFIDKLGKKRGHGYVICFVKEAVLLSSEVSAIPVSAI